MKYEVEFEWLGDDPQESEIDDWDNAGDIISF